MSENITVTETLDKIYFQPLTTSSLTLEPYPSGKYPPAVEIRKDSKGSSIFETFDTEWVEAHIRAGHFREVITTGLPDGDFTITIVKPKIKGYKTEYIFHMWFNGHCEEVIMQDKDILSFAKFENAVFNKFHRIPEYMKAAEWKAHLTDKCATAEITEGEFLDAPVYVDFFNFIERATPIFNKEDLSIETNDAVWYDEATNEIRPLYNQIEGILAKYPNTKVQELVNILGDVRKGNTRQDWIGKGNKRKKVSYWVIYPDKFTTFMARIHSEQQKRVKGEIQTVTDTRAGILRED